MLRHGYTYSALASLIRVAVQASDKQEHEEQERRPEEAREAERHSVLYVEGRLYGFVSRDRAADAREMEDL